MVVDSHLLTGAPLKGGCQAVCYEFNALSKSLSQATTGICPNKMVLDSVSLGFKHFKNAKECTKFHHCDTKFKKVW